MEFGPVRIRAIIDPDEASRTEPLIEKVCALAGFDLAAHREAHPGEPIRSNRFELSVAPAEGLTSSLYVLSARIGTKKDAMACFDAIVRRLSEEDRAFLIDSLDSRFDDDSQCFVRLDKKLFLNDVFALVDHGKCVHFTFSILTYPKNRDAAFAFLKEHLAPSERKPL